MKTLLPKEGTNLRPVKGAHGDDCVLSLKQNDKLCHKPKRILLKKHVHRAFYWLKYTCISLSDV